MGNVVDLAGVGDEAVACSRQGLIRPAFHFFFVDDIMSRVSSQLCIYRSVLVSG
jgi:hypothetical protein